MRNHHLVLLPLALLLSGVTAIACTGSTEPRETAPTLEPTTFEALTPTSLAGGVMTVVTPAPTVRLKDQNGQPMQGVEVLFGFSVPTYSAEVFPSVRVATDVNGVASVVWRLGARLGAYSVTASSPSVPAVVFTATASAGPVSRMVAWGGGQRGIVGTTLGSPLSVWVGDGFGNGIDGVTVTFSVVAGGGSILGETVTTDGGGEATSGAWTLGAMIGEQRVQAQVDSVDVYFTAYAYDRPLGECSRVCADAGRIAFIRDGNIHHVNVQGADLVQLTNGGTDRTPAWSPDGRRIAFARRVSSETGLGDVHVMDAAGTSPSRRISTAGGWAPAWKPDGSRIAYGALCEGNGCIVVRNADGDDPLPVRLGNPRGYNNEPAWSPDGDGIAFVSDYVAFDFIYDIYVASLTGSPITQLTDGFGGWRDGFYFLHPAWSPDGARIAFVYGRIINDSDMRFTVAVMNPDGSGKRDLARAGDIPWMNLLDPGSLTWSPDGSRIAFTFIDCDLTTPTTCTRPPSIKYVSVDGSEEGVIVSNAWSPSWKR